MAWSTLLGLADGAVSDAFGETVTYAPSEGEPVQVSGVFEAAYRLVETAEAGVSSTSPAVFFKLADLPANPEEDSPTITIGSSNYSIRECRKDGQGGVLILLHEV